MSTMIDACAVAFVLSGAGFGPAEGLVDYAGLLKRLAVTVGFGWLTMLAVHLLRDLRATEKHAG